MSVTLPSSRLKDGRVEEGRPKALQVPRCAQLPAVQEGPPRGVPWRLTWNGGCDRWLDGVGLLHEGLDAGDGEVESQSRDYNSGYSPGLALASQG